MDVRGFGREPEGESGVVVIVDSGGRGVLSSARRRVGVGRAGSRVGEAASQRAVTGLRIAERPNLLQSLFPGHRRAV